MDKYAQKDKKNMCNNCKETNQPENPTAINAAVELKEASDAVKRIHSAISDKGLTYYIETYGCQMNEHDSENIAGMLVRCGYTKADCKETADFILFNTCCVREHAELRTFGNVGFVKELKQKNPRLLKRVNDEVRGLKRLRFMTSHPKDLSDELIDAMASLDKVCKHIHLPVQSGSDRILRLMNRKYTSADYYALVDKLRTRVKDVEITTDIIVGFPQETEEDFNATCALVRNVGYSNAYTFAYSPREGTVAARMDGQIPLEEKKRRLNALNAVLAETLPAGNEKYIGYEGDILVEGVDHRGEPLLFGKLSNFKMVYVKGDESLVGTVVPVKVDGLRFNSLQGHITD